ncbi:MAG: hypothetical protein HRU35_03675 [Rickettsiaceae bacterium]|nr:hypothetical protein [Rickettsiaceae bacterium]
MLYEAKDLASAREFLNESQFKVTLTNPSGSTRYYGMRVINYIFKTLKQEFPDKIDQIIVNVDDDYSALITAQKLGLITTSLINSKNPSS